MRLIQQRPQPKAEDPASEHPSSVAFLRQTPSISSSDHQKILARGIKEIVGGYAYVAPTITLNIPRLPLRLRRHEVAMARPFDDQMSSQYNSIVSSQTSLAANRAWAMSGERAYPASTIYGENGQIWKYKSNGKSNKASTEPRLAKIKSPPSNGALAAARKSASHGKLHKRGTSASTTQSPLTPTFDTNQRFPDLMTPPSVYSPQTSISSPRSVVKNRVKIRPMLRKLSFSDVNVNSIDLSRSAAENEGLGIFSPSDLGSDGRTSADALRAYHHRSDSQVSTNTSSGNHPNPTQYIHPFRQTPRPYTPPLATSYQISLENEPTHAGPVSASSNAPDLDSYYGQPVNSTSDAPLPSSHRRPPPLHIRTHSSSRLTSSSQTNLPGTPSSLRQQNSIKAPDTMLTSERSSLETVFRKRSRANTITNPETEAAEYAARAATVAYLRREFNDREEAKELRYLEAEARAQAKETAKRQKREESQSRKSEAKERKRAQSNAASEKTLPMAECDTAQPFIPAPSHDFVQPRRRRATGASLGKGILNRWQLFMFKLRTAWLKLLRLMSMK